MLAYHTLHVPHQTNDPDYWETDPFLRQHVAQINAAGRYVAAQQHFHVLDMEAMALQVSKATILIDRTHPGPDFMMQVPSSWPAQTSANACMGVADADCQFDVLLDARSFGNP